MININEEFEYAGGTLSVHLENKSAQVLFKKDGDTVLIEDSSGKPIAWDRYYDDEWLSFSDDEIEKAEKELAKEYAIDALGNNIIVMNNE